MSAPARRGSASRRQSHQGTAEPWTLSRGHLPVVEQVRVSIDPGERRRIDQLADLLERRERLLASHNAFGPNVASGAFEGPALLLADYSSLGLFGVGGTPGLEYRMFLLARDEDRVVFVGERNEAFECYCRTVLQQAHAEILSPAGRSDTFTAMRCREDPRLLSQVVQLARDHGALTVVPFIGNGPVWALAGEIANRSGVRVGVLASSPKLTQRVNDKLWFLRRVEEVLGKTRLPLTFEAFGSTALAAKVASVARDHSQVCVKLPNSAGSMGNVVLESDSLRGLGLRSLRQELMARLGQLGWGATSPLMVEVWESPVLFSPSVQLWIPDRELGLPVVEGIFEQIIEGPIGEFVGARPIELPDKWQRRVAGEAVLLGYYFQRLGYVGRCSLDAILVGERLDDLEETAIHWIECNGRWGGTSIPMTLVNRLVGDWAAAPFVVLQKECRYRPPGTFTSFLEGTRERLYLPGRKRGVLFFAPSRIERGTGLDVIVIDETLEAANKEARLLAAMFN